MVTLPALLTTLGFALLGYLCGSLPFAIWITRLFKGVDVREAGSGHATTTNTIRQAEFGPGALVLMLDIAKGFLPTWLALRTVGQNGILSNMPWIGKNPRDDIIPPCKIPPPSSSAHLFTVY